MYPVLSQDYKKALEWLTKSAEQGNIKAEAQLGDMYSMEIKML